MIDDEARSRLLDSLRESWIDGARWTTGERGIPHNNPATGQDLGETQDAGVAAVDHAVAAARRAFSGSWGENAARRHDLMLAFADGIARHTDELAILEALEMGRPVKGAAALIGQAPLLIRRYIALTERFQGDLFAADDRRLGAVWRRPRGVVAAIVPWNVPAMNVLIRVAPALAAGNCIVVKPSEYAPRSAVLLARLASEAGLPDGVFSVVLGSGTTTGGALAAHPGIDLVSFTGSTGTGLAVARAAAAHTLKPVMLECGGKSPQLVLDDVIEDPDIWGPIFFSSFWNTGQWCAAKTRLLVPRGKGNAAAHGLAAASRAWKIDDPTREGAMLGPLANRLQRDRVLEHFERAATDGEVVQLDCPEGALHEAGCYARPSVVIGLPRGSAVAREEVFGPLATIEEFDDLDDAVALANLSDYGLSASVWTRRGDLGHRLSRGIDAGGITVCSSAEALAQALPELGSNRYFEPQKQSGYGVDGGLPGLLAYTRPQSVTMLH